MIRDVLKNKIYSLIQKNKAVGGVEDTLEQTLSATGFAYDPNQDIYYSKMDAWQRKYGYCQLYDEANAPLNMIIDCEPVRFEYSGQKWLIELWKGQYGMTTGGEIGVYVAQGLDLDIPGVFNGTFYNAVEDTDLLDMSFILRKNGEARFERKDKHWWLTGFVLGEFSEPSELSMEARITLKDGEMCEAFVGELERMGYSDSEIRMADNTVSLVFGTPRSKQPLSRIAATDWIIQRKNEFLCRQYQKLTGGLSGAAEKIAAVQKSDSLIYSLLFQMAKPPELFRMYETFRDYMYGQDA